jgi:hypothetical protein
VNSRRIHFGSCLCGAVRRKDTGSVHAANLLVVPAGSLDSDVTLKPDAHIFWSSKAHWDNGLGGIPMMEGSP